MGQEKYRTLDKSKYMKLIYNLMKYIRDDWNTYPLRFCAEFFSWLCSVISAIIFAVTAPDIPIIPLYCIFISGCISAAWCCYTRGSFGLMANAVFLVTIDSIGLVKIISTSI